MDCDERQKDAENFGGEGQFTKPKENRQQFLERKGDASRHLPFGSGKAAVLFLSPSLGTSAP